MELQKKIYTTIKQASNDADRTVQFVISDETPDRDGDIIMVDGWDFASFLKNPVCMGFHEYDTYPFGKWTRIEKDMRSIPRRVIGTLKFPTIQEMCPTGDVSEHAKNVEMAYNMVKNGYLNAVSVGCYYKTAEPRTDYPEGTPDWMRGRKVTKSELIEVSLVPIPANSNALSMINADKAIDDKMKEYVSKSFKENIEDKKAIPFKHYELAPEDTKWDGPAVVAASEMEDLKKICTWYDSEKADEDLTKGDFKLPHHMSKADGYKTVWAGVRAAVGVLFGARGGAIIPEADIEKVKAHLKKHYVEFDKPWPEDEKSWTEQEKAYTQKEGRRLSAATLALVDELKAGLVEFDEAIVALQGCRRNMEKRIKALESGSSEEPDDMGNDDEEKSVVIHFVD